MSVSGNIVNTSGQVAAISGQAITVSGNIVNTSGQVAQVSGQAVTISGNWIVFSGGLISVSGNVMLTSGQVAQVSGQAVTVSGNRVQLTYITTAVRTRNLLPASFASGGTVLLSGDVSQITIRALSGNASVVFVGGVTAGDAPWANSAASGAGFPLGPGDGMEFPVTNFNLVAVCAATARHIW